VRLCFLCCSVSEGLPVEWSFLLLQLGLQEGCLGVGMQAHYAQGMCPPACRLIREKAVQVADTRTGSTVMAIKNTMY